MGTCVPREEVESIPVPAPGSFDAFYLEFKDAVFAYARVLDRDRAEDLLAEAFWRYWDRFQAGERIDNPMGYLILTVRNLHLDGLRRRKREAARIAVVARAPAADRFLAPGEGLGRKEDEAKVRQAVAALPEELREALVLYVWSGLTFPQVAEVTGVSVGTAFARYRQALAELRRTLEGRQA